jgi:L-seryl-tRNA(Ser) seleniumtransferase
VASAVHTADLVVFSGDKLLGGPQAGCVVGDRSLIRALRRNPLARALRADKLTLAALEATLALYRDRESAVASVPVLRMLTLPADELASRARDLAARLPAGARPTTRPGRSAVGGGSFPEAELPTTLVVLHPADRSAHAFALALRLGNPSVLARVESDRVVLDPRTLPAERLDDVAGAIHHALTL